MSRLEGVRPQTVFLPLVFRDSHWPVCRLSCCQAQQELGTCSKFETGLMCLMPSSLPRPRRIKPGHGVFLSGSWFMGLEQEKQRVWMCLKCAGEDPKTALWKKLPLGLKSPQPHMLRQRSDPNSNLSPGPGSTFHLCTVCPRVGRTLRADMWRGIKRTAYVIDDLSGHKKQSTDISSRW